MAALFVENWLHNCNAMYRSALVGSEYFENYNTFSEWTWLAYKIGLADHKVEALNFPGFIYHDTAGSLSKSDVYFSGHLPLFERMLSCFPPPHVRGLIKRKIAAHHHEVSNASLERGDIKSALVHHLKSLLSPGGWKYIGYSRHLLRVL